jgi:hypothetical protein
MNTSRVLRISMLELVIVALILLAVTGLAILVSVAWPLIHVPSSPSPIQANRLKMVNAFHDAVNSDNVEAVLALFEENATVTDHGSAIEGTEQIRNWALQ